MRRNLEEFELLNITLQLRRAAMGRRFESDPRLHA